jgi:hypothetical protein
LNEEKNTDREHFNTDDIKNLTNFYDTETIKENIEKRKMNKSITLTYKSFINIKTLLRIMWIKS